MARTGHEVSLLGRSWHLDAVRRQGLLISGIWGEYRIKAFDLYTSPEEIAREGRSFDLVILTVKSYDTPSAAGALKTLLGDTAVLLSLQNGLGNIETLLAAVDPARYLVGRVIFGVELSPGHAHVTVEADPIAIGRAPGAPPPRLRPETLAQALSASRISSVAVPDILPYIWAKAVYNCALNPLCALSGIPYGDLLKDPERRARMERIVRECYAVAGAWSITLAPGSAEAYLELLVGRLIPRTASHYPSMLADLRRGRTDIDALNGAICRLGREKGVPTPENLAVTEAIRSLTPSPKST